MLGNQTPVTSPPVVRSEPRSVWWTDSAAPTSLPSPQEPGLGGGGGGPGGPAEGTGQKGR